MPVKRWLTLPRAFATLLVLYALLEWGFRASLAAGVLLVILEILGTVLVFRLIVRAIRKSIWRLRNRLYVTYVFIGIVPIVLILLLAVSGTWIVTGQIAVYLMSSELDRRAATLLTEARILSQAKPGERAAAMEHMGRLLGQ